MVDWKNVFQLWDDGGRKVPFRVRRWSWHPDTYFVVEKVEVSEKNWNYYKEKGKLYGKAFGVMHRSKGYIGGYEGLNCAGCYQWVRVEGSSVIE